MKKYQLLGLIFTALSVSINAQKPVTDIPVQQNEYWWGIATGLGSSMPLNHHTISFDLSKDYLNNQVVPLLLSNKGRLIWSDQPFKIKVKQDKLEFTDLANPIEAISVGNTLRSAFIEASKRHFKPSGKMPDSLFFTKPQYNTWIELMYNQNQADILKYVNQLEQHSFAPGVLMIDDNWQKYYGNFEFRPDKFPDPKQMISELHKKGFKVMLWICPFVSSDSPEYRDLGKKGFLIKEKGTKDPITIKWWNGQSACYDLTNPQAYEFFADQLRKMQAEYGIDGFKFDAGDNVFYPTGKFENFIPGARSVDHTMAWQKLGLQFPFNEYRAGWKMGGQPLVERLGDKKYEWDAVRLLIPEMLAAGLLGYPFTCPDMIGGGSFSTFLDINEAEFDQTLIVRSAQVHALMPMMQFSVAPWRILNNENLGYVQKAAQLHEQFAPYIIKYAKLAAKTGEPIVRHLEYQYPNQGFENCKDQFMLGEDYLVTPVLNSTFQRSVKLPKGKWKDDLGKVYTGGKIINIDVPLSRLPYFKRL